jgi:hypothetical protein
MPRHCIVPLLLLVAPAVHAQAAPSAPDTAGVRAAVEHYLQGHATGDGRHFQMVFHPVSMLFFTDNGQFRSRTGVEYVAGAPGKPADDEAQRKRRIVFVDADGDAGVAKVELDYPQVRFIDYFTLLRLNGEWKIMNKIFTRYPKQ